MSSSTSKQTDSKRSESERSDYDGHYKRIFSHQQMFQDLITGFFPQCEWAQNLNFEGADSLSTESVSTSMTRRHQDLVWRVQTEDGRRLHLAFEFQAKRDPSMVPRMLAYWGLLVEKLVNVQGLKEDDILPLAVPIVIYHGSVGLARTYGGGLERASSQEVIGPGLPGELLL